MDLHIGVTNSEGDVVEFDKGGLQRHRTRLWHQCLVVDGAAGPWREHWDSTLKVMTDQECWSPQMYVLMATMWFIFVTKYSRLLVAWRYRDWRGVYFLVSVLPCKPVNMGH